MKKTIFTTQFKIQEHPYPNTIHKMHARILLIAKKSHNFRNGTVEMKIRVRNKKLMLLGQCHFDVHHLRYAHE